MDVWHTCEPDILATEGWLGRTIRDIDPNKENVLTGVNFGRGLPHALALPGVPVASVGNLATYGLLTGIEDEERMTALDTFSRIYSPRWAAPSPTTTCPRPEWTPSRVPTS